MEYFSAFVLGLGGSLHCAGMCGPLLVALLPGGRGGAAGASSRAAYHGGRILTYVLLGLVLGLVGHGLHLAGWQRGLSLVAGVLLLTGGFLASRLALDAWLVRSVGWVKRLFGLGLGRRGVPSMVLLGMANGFLPCGLVYAAGLSAAASGSALSGAGAMALFGLGTLPVLLAFDRLGRHLPAAVRGRLQAAVPWIVAGVGTLLVLRGLGLGIPYLSPSTAGACPRCDP